MATSNINFGKDDDARRRSAFSDFSARLDRLALSGDPEIVGAYISNSLERLDPANNPVSPDIETMIDQDTAYASILETAAKWYRSQGDTDSAESCLKRASGLLVQDGLEDSAQYAGVLVELAIVNCDKGEHGVSRMLLRSAHRTFDSLSESARIEYAECEESLAHAEDASGDFPAALAHARSAYDILEELLPSTDPRISSYREFRDLLEGMSE